MKKSLVAAGALLVLLISCQAGLAKTMEGDRLVAGAENGAFVIPDVQKFGDAKGPDVELLKRQGDNKRVGTVRGDRRAAKAAEVDAVPRRSSNDDDWLGQIVLSVVAGTMGVGGAALLVSGLRRRPSKRHKHAIAAVVGSVRNSTQRKLRGRPALAGSIMPAAQKDVSYSVSNIQDAAEVAELNKAA